LVLFGLGLFSRKHGFVVDYVVFFEVVMVDGCVRYVDVMNECDLFWVLCGGKGLFGVVI